MRHDAGCECGAYACELRNKDIGVSMKVIPNRIANRKPPVVKFADPPSWERERIGHRNNDGTFVPVINEKGLPLRRKEYSERRVEIDKILRRRRQNIVIQP